MKFLSIAKYMFIDSETERYSVRRIASVAWSVIVIFGGVASILFFSLPRLASTLSTAVNEGDGATLVTAAVASMVTALFFLFKFTPRTKKDSH